MTELSTFLTVIVDEKRKEEEEVEEEEEEKKKKKKKCPVYNLPDRKLCDTQLVTVVCFSFAALCTRLQ